MLCFYVCHVAPHLVPAVTVIWKFYEAITVHSFGEQYQGLAVHL
jgi:hypothetical protein